MKLGFENVELVGMNCPYFLGIKDHGQKAIFKLDTDTDIYFNAYSENSALNVHQDGTIYISKMKYNYNKEEYEDKVFLDLTDDKVVRASLDNWLKSNNLYKSKLFPYPVSTTKTTFGAELIATDLDSLLNYLKTF